MNLNFQKENPTQSGTYLAVCVIDGDQVLMEAEYTTHNQKWEVQLYQTYDPHWADLYVNVLCWAEVNYGELQELL